MWKYFFFFRGEQKRTKRSPRVSELNGNGIQVWESMKGLSWKFNEPWLSKLYIYFLFLDNYLNGFLLVTSIFHKSHEHKIYFLLLRCIGVNILKRHLLAGWKFELSVRKYWACERVRERREKFSHLVAVWSSLYCPTLPRIVLYNFECRRKKSDLPVFKKISARAPRHFYA